MEASVSLPVIPWRDNALRAHSARPNPVSNVSLPGLPISTSGSLGARRDDTDPANLSGTVAAAAATAAAE
eukprot:14413046-Alexandrium_andersonii.AAC.1